jgi:hypothetical protein
MEAERTRTAVRERTETASAQAHLGGSTGELLQSTLGWAAVAREAFENVERGADAERELRRRRNASGQ